MAKIKAKTDRVFVNGEKAEIGKVYEVSEAVAKEMVSNGFAEKSAAKAQKKRARNKDGTLKADDPNTPDVNEAWE